MQYHNTVEEREKAELEHAIMSHILPRLDKSAWPNLTFSLENSTIWCYHKDHRNELLHIVLNVDRDYILVNYHRHSEQVSLASPDMVEQISMILSRFNFNPERTFTKYHRSRN